MRGLVGLLCLLLALPAPASAQQTGSLLRGEADAGERITVITSNGTRFSGRLVADEAGTLTVRSGGSERRIVHAEVARVDRKRNRFLLGPLIGLAAGLAVGLPLKRRFDNEGKDGDVWLGTMVGIGVGAGSVIDLFNGSTRTIYAR